MLQVVAELGLHLMYSNEHIRIDILDISDIDIITLIIYEDICSINHPNRCGYPLGIIYPKTDQHLYFHAFLQVFSSSKLAMENHHSERHNLLRYGIVWK